MGFSVPVGGEVRVSFNVPNDATTLWLGCGVEGNGGGVAFRAWLRSSKGAPQLVFDQTAAAGHWLDEVVNLRSHRGHKVELVLQSSHLETQAADVAYWATPAVVAATRDRPGILLICIDSLRADHLGCYGYAKATSPTLDSLASVGCLFSRAIAQSSWTLPSHASLFTSLYVRSHGVHSGGTVLSPVADTLSELLRDEGYLTAAFLAGPTLVPQYGLSQGFDLYDARCSGRDAAQIYRNPTNLCTHRKALDWLRRWGEAPFFVFLHYWDVHFDYNPPAPYDTLFDPDYQGSLDGRNFLEDDRIRPGLPLRDLEHLVALYDGEIAHTDRYLGMLFNEMRRMGVGHSALVVVTSDHGDEFLEHGAKGHGHTLFQELVHVPLIWADPNRATSPLVVESPVQMIDVAPSILEFAGRDVPRQMEGKSLVGLMRRQPQEQTPIFAELSAIKGSQEQLSALLLGSSKIIHSAFRDQFEAYDLGADPSELHPLAPEELAGGTALRDALASFLEEKELALEVRVVDTGQRGSFLFRVTSGEPLSPIVPRDLERADSLEVKRDGRVVDFKPQCLPGDTDGLTLRLPSETTSITISARLEGKPIPPGRVILGRGKRPASVPFSTRGGDPRLRGSPSVTSEGPALYLWTSRQGRETLATPSVELSEKLRDQLTQLGYLR